MDMNKLYIHLDMIIIVGLIFYTKMRSQNYVHVDKY